jgi:hypothetical protein
MHTGHRTERPDNGGADKLDGQDGQEKPVTEHDRRNPPSVCVEGSQDDSATGVGTRDLIGATSPEPARQDPSGPEAASPGLGEDYDLAFSFAGSDRTYVEATKLACERLGLRVMYDRDLSNEWWGENYVAERRTGHGGRARYFVPFVSHEYFRRPVPADEFAAALWTDVRRGGGRLLPVIIGDVVVPPQRLHPHVGYLRSDQYSPDRLAVEMLRKVRHPTATGEREPRTVDTFVGETLGLRLPKLVPSDFSRYDELDAVLGHLSNRFDKALPALRGADCVGAVRQSSDAVRITVRRAGSLVHRLEIHQRGDGDCTLYFGRDPHGGYRASAEPFFDRETGRPALKFLNLSLLPLPEGSVTVMTKEELFGRLWEALIHEVESRA